MSRQESNVLEVLALASALVCDDGSSSSSSSEEEYDEDDDCDIFDETSQLYAILMVGETRGETLPTEKLYDFVERVVPGYSDERFKEDFRMYPATFEAVLQLIGPALDAVKPSGGRPCIPAQKQLLIALWFMATPDSYRSVSSRFGVGKATAFRAVRRVTYALHCVAPRLIRWPRGPDANRVMAEFARAKGFPNTIGAMDGVHIEIRAPHEDAASYVSRKQNHTIQMQAVCDARNLFIHCFAGYPGSVHDARVYRNSPIALEYVERPEEYFPNNSHLIADAAYGIHPCIMTPYRNNGHLTERQKNYNYCLSATRMAIERTYGLLKVRFRILLDCLPLTDVRMIPQFILACCVLHNICILRNDLFPVHVCPGNIDNPALAERFAADAAGGGLKRDLIMNGLRIVERAPRRQ